jgi:hypothetical protein
MIHKLYCTRAFEFSEIDLILRQLTIYDLYGKLKKDIFNDDDFSKIYREYVNTFYVEQSFEQLDRFSDLFFDLLPCLKTPGSYQASFCYAKNFLHLELEPNTLPYLRLRRMAKEKLNDLKKLEGFPEILIGDQLKQYQEVSLHPKDAEFKLVYITCLAHARFGSPETIKTVIQKLKDFFKSDRINHIEKNLFHSLLIDFIFSQFEIHDSPLSQFEIKQLFDLFKMYVEDKSIAQAMHRLYGEIQCEGLMHNNSSMEESLFNLRSFLQEKRGKGFENWFRAIQIYNEIQDGCEDGVGEFVSCIIAKDISDDYKAILLAFIEDLFLTKRELFTENLMWEFEKAEPNLVAHLQEKFDELKSSASAVNLIMLEEQGQLLESDEIASSLESTS